jgi:multidrug transporter EmrE-like cation transporter
LQTFLKKTYKTEKQENKTMKNILLILGSVSLNAAAQLCIRKGMLKIGEVPSDIASIFKAAPSMLSNLFLWSALLAYAFSLILWMVVLSKVEVTFAYPFLSLGFVLVTISSFLIFNENISPLRIAGIALICLGVFFVSRS